jgi:hypothetical protein
VGKQEQSNGVIYLFILQQNNISNQGFTQMDLEQAQSHEHIFPQLDWPGIHHVH